jgi:hypothetical protein
MIISNDPIATVGVAATMAGPGTPYLFAFELQVATPIHQVRWHMGATATGHTNIALYTGAGALVAGSDTGAQSNSASTTSTFTYATDVLLSPGQYWLAIACDNTTDTYEGITGMNTRISTTRQRTGTNALAAGAMPLTLGTIVNNAGNTISVAAIPTGSVIV